MIEWNKITDEEMRSAVVADIRSRMSVMTDQADRNERYAADRSRKYSARKEDEACAAYSRRQAAHYQQAIDLLTAAPMPVDNSVATKIASAVDILRSRNIDACANDGSISVRSRLLPCYLVRGVDRERWTAQEIADDIERSEQQDAALMPTKEET